MNEEKSILAIRIYQMRKELNLTQEELASKLGLKGKSSIANYESGKITPSDEIKLKMCKIFNCSMDDLMGKSLFRTNKDAYSDLVKISIAREITNKHINIIVTINKIIAFSIYI